MPPLGTLNLHGSLLPRYRGAAPINWAIINGETETGVTTFLLRHEIDTGDILFQERIPIGENETAGELHDRMMHIGAQLILKTVQSIEHDQVQPQPQDLSAVTLAPKIFTETCRIDFSQSTQQVHNFVRGLSPFPGAWTFFDERVLKILRTKKDDTTPLKGNIGQFFSDGRQYLCVRTQNGYVQILDLQLEGKKRMPVRDFLNGIKYNWISI
jgi:methionyl-tRNA formyltransferase